MLVGGRIAEKIGDPIFLDYPINGPVTASPRAVVTNKTDTVVGLF
jgi:hypothetical protein